jgi:hypothetical protein
MVPAIGNFNSSNSARFEASKEAFFKYDTKNLTLLSYYAESSGVLSVSISKKIYLLAV